MNRREAPEQEVEGMVPKVCPNCRKEVRSTIGLNRIICCPRCSYPFGPAPEQEAVFDQLDIAQRFNIDLTTAMQIAEWMQSKCIAEPAPEQDLREQYKQMFADDVPMECRTIYTEWMPIEDADVLWSNNFDIRPAPITLDTPVTEWLEILPVEAYTHSNTLIVTSWMKPDKSELGKTLRESFAGNKKDKVTKTKVRYRNLPETEVTLSLEAEPAPEQEASPCNHEGGCNVHGNCFFCGKHIKPEQEPKPDSVAASWITVADQRIADLEDIVDGLGRRVQELEERGA